MSGITRYSDILLDAVKLCPLLVYHMRYISEQLVELANRLLNIADLGLALDNKGFLEVHLVL